MGNTLGTNIKLPAGFSEKINAEVKEFTNPELEPREPFNIDYDNWANVEVFLGNIIDHIATTQKVQFQKLVDTELETNGPDAATKMHKSLFAAIDSLYTMKSMLSFFKNEICSLVAKYLLPYFDPKLQCIKLDELQKLQEDLIKSTQEATLKEEAAEVEGADASVFDDPQFDQYKDLSSEYFKPVWANLEAVCYILYELKTKQVITPEEEQQLAELRKHYPQATLEDLRWLRTDSDSEEEEEDDFDDFEGLVGGKFTPEQQKQVDSLFAVVRELKLNPGDQIPKELVQQQLNGLLDVMKKQ